MPSKDRHQSVFEASTQFAAITSNNDMMQDHWCVRVCVMNKAAGHLGTCQVYTCEGCSRHGHVVLVITCRTYVHVLLYMELGAWSILDQRILLATYFKPTTTSTTRLPLHPESLGLVSERIAQGLCGV